MTRSHSAGLDPLEAVRLLRATGGALLEQALLHGELARVSWAQERGRLQRMLVSALLGGACALCTLLFCGALVVAAAWDTPWRLPALGALVVVHGALAAVAWRHVVAEAARGGHLFDDSRRELAADAALLRAAL